MKTKKFAAIYRTGEDCNCSFSHDTNVDAEYFDTKKEAVEYGKTMEGNPHKHTVHESVVVEAYYFNGKEYEPAEDERISVVWTRSWNYQTKEYDRKIFRCDKKERSKS